MSEQHIVYPAPKKPRRWLTAGIATATLLVGFGIGSIDNGGDVAAPAPTVTVEAPSETVTAKPSAKPSSKPTIEATESGVGDGNFQVGVDIKSGRYKTVVPDDSYGCYWERAKNDSGETDSIIALNWLDPGAHASVTIKNNEFFSSQGCGLWELQK